MALATVVPGKGGTVGCYISDSPLSVPPTGCGLGWATSPLRNLRVGSVALSQEAWPHVHSGVFKRCGLGWDAELEERLVVVFPFINPWDFGESVSFQRRFKVMMLPVVFAGASLSAVAGEVSRILHEVRRGPVLLAPLKDNQTGSKETIYIDHVVLVLGKRAAGAQSQLPQDLPFCSTSL